MDLSPEDASLVVVGDEILTNFVLFQGYRVGVILTPKSSCCPPQPNVEESSGTVRITTYSYMEYDLDVLDFNKHLSAR